MSSMRLRLTLLVAVLTALAGAAATVFGVGVIRDRVLDGLVDDQVAAVEFQIAFSEQILAEIEASEELEAELFEAEVADGEFPLDAEFDDFFTTIESQVAISYAFALEAGSEEFLEVLEWLGVEPGDPIPVLLDDGRVGAVPPSTGGEVALRPIPSGSLVIPSWAIGTFELAGVGIDASVIGADDVFSVEVGGELVEADADGVAELFGASRELTFVERTVLGQPVLLVIEEGDTLASLDEVQAALWVATVLLTLLAALAAWFLMGRALRPVARITRQADSISSGTMHERVPVPARKDEIHGLATTVNRMLDRLELGDRRRRQFVSDASHELRSPVAVLRTEAEVALRHPDATAVPDLAGVVLGEADRLGTIVEDLLTLARRDEGRLTGAPAEIDLDDLVLIEAERARRVPVGRSAVSAGRVRGRSDELCRIIAHLLDNAARHAVNRVEVGLATRGDRVLLWVEDDGAGVAPADRSRIFERFTRLDEARTRDAGGAGLGLAVVAETVTDLGGDVRVVDGQLGGARFEVELPSAG